MNETPSGGLVRGALAAWAAMLGAVAILGAGLEVSGLGKDQDISGPGELTFIFLMFLAIPLALISFGVLLPFFAALQRLVREPLSRISNALIGIALSAPALAVFVVLNWALQPRRGKTLTQDFDAIVHRPRQMLPILAIFAIGGLVFGITLPRKQTPS